MTTVYVSGPMTGIPDHNFPLFKRVTKQLRDSGYVVMCPTEINPLHDTSWLDCMRNDIKALCECDMIFLLPGWENSKGATLEHDIALRLGLKISVVSSNSSWPEVI